MSSLHTKRAIIVAWNTGNCNKETRDRSIIYISCCLLIHCQRRISLIDSVVSNFVIIVHGVLERVWKKTLVVYFKEMFLPFSCEDRGLVRKAGHQTEALSLTGRPKYQPGVISSLCGSSLYFLRHCTTYKTWFLYWNFIIVTNTIFRSLVWRCHLRISGGKLNILTDVMIALSPSSRMLRNIFIQVPNSSFPIL